MKSIIPDRLNITNPDIVENVYKEYISAGCDIISTNTFSSHPLKVDNYKETIKKGVDIAKKAVAESGRDVLIALSIGPCGRMLLPFGDLSYKDSLEYYKSIACVGKECGVDIFLYETFSDPYEMKSAVVGTRQVSDAPIFCSFSYGENRRTLTGADVLCQISLLDGLNVDGYGINCGVGPIQAEENIKKMCKNTNAVTFVQPNAGMPVLHSDGSLSYDITSEIFAQKMVDISKTGVSVIGGCCGTTPDYIKKVISRIGKGQTIEKSRCNRRFISSYAKAVNVCESFSFGKLDCNNEFMIDDAFDIAASGADAIVMHGFNGEEDCEKVFSLQEVINLPIIIKNDNKKIINAIIDGYNGTVGVISEIKDIEGAVLVNEDIGKLIEA